MMLFLTNQLINQYIERSGTKNESFRHKVTCSTAANVRITALVTLSRHLRSEITAFPLVFHGYTTIPGGKRSLHYDNRWVSVSGGSQVVFLGSAGTCFHYPEWSHNQKFWELFKRSHCFGLSNPVRPPEICRMGGWSCVSPDWVCHRQEMISYQSYQCADGIRVLSSPSHSSPLLQCMYTHQTIAPGSPWAKKCHDMAMTPSIGNRSGSSQ